MICSSVNRFRFIVRLLERTQHNNEGISGKQVTQSRHLQGHHPSAPSSPASRD
jgi:hypothetical protein